ncbi:MAG: hypothetical protein ABIR27_06605 [Dokdonella sp.]
MRVVKLPETMVVEVDDSARDGITNPLQNNNVTNEPSHQLFNDSGLRQRSDEYARQYLLGVTYKFCST